MTRPASPFPEAAARAVCALAEASPDREVCGFVREGPAGPEIIPARNVAADPALGFLMAPDAVLEALRAADEPRHQLIALYHSHPSGGAWLSGRDLAELVVDGQPALPGVHLWVVELERGRAIEVRSYSWSGSGYRERARFLPGGGAG